MVLSQHENVEGEPFALADTNALARFAAGATVVVNCAGPFAETAPILVGAALAACAHYVDITGEPPVVADLIERFDVPARAAAKSGPARGRVLRRLAGSAGESRRR